MVFYLTYDKLHIWDLKDYKRDLCVAISRHGRNLIKSALKLKYSSLKLAAKINNLEYTGLLHLLRGRWSFNFNILMKFIKLLNLNKNQIEKEIEDIIIRSIRIKEVKFPIVCDPIFSSLAVNMVGDGGVHKNNKYTGVFHYGEKESYELIHNKIKHIIGETPYTDGKSVPAVLVFLLQEYFKIKSFYTKNLSSQKGF